MQTTLSGNILHNDFRRYEDNEKKQGLLFSNQSVEDENKLRFELTNFINQWTVSSGFMAQYARYTNTTTDETARVAYETNTTFYRFGFYTQLSRPLFKEKLTPSFGIRTDGNTFTDQGTNLLNTLSPRLSLSYAFTPRWTLNTAIGRYYKIPPYTILGFKDEQGNYANKDSKYIQSTHYVAGLEFLPRRSTRITLEGFFKKYEHYPVSVRDSVSLANLGGSYEILGNEDIVSIGLGRAYGVEFLLQQKLNRRFYGILAYTLYWSEFTGFDPDHYIPSVWDNRHLITFTGGYKLTGNWEIGLRARYLGATPYAPVDINATTAAYPTIIEDYSQLGQVRLKPFNQIDIRVDKKWNFTGWTFNVFLEIQNILGSNLPSPPTYTLKREANSQIQLPRQLVKVTGTDNSASIPTLGIVVDL